MNAFNTVSRIAYMSDTVFDNAGVGVFLNANAPDIVLDVTDNGSGMADSLAESREGFGFSNMRARAESIGAQLDVRAASGRGRTIAVHLPTNF
jgi:signal transduction histidine kinase